MPDKKHATLSGRLVIIGFGSIGQGVLPLLLRHLDLSPERITIVTAEPRGHKEAAEYGVRFVETALTRENYRAVLDPLLSAGDFLLNVSVEVASVALIELCQEKSALYLDTCIEPWPGGYTDPNLTPSQRSNYALREQALALRQRYPSGRQRSSPTAPIPVSYRISSSRRSSISRASPTLPPPYPQTAPAGGASPSSSGSKSSTSPSATTQSPRSRNRPASSSTPGRSRGFSARARSRPNSAGARMNGISPRTGGATILAAAPRSICCGRAPEPGCAAGRRSRGPISGF